MWMLEYGEIYAFDDGAMPEYERQLPGKPVATVDFAIRETAHVDQSQV
jgi:hypothetical protein